MSKSLPDHLKFRVIGHHMEKWTKLQMYFKYLKSGNDRYK